MKLNEKALANSLTAISFVWYLFCVALAVVAPDLLLAIYQPWFHRLDMSQVWMENPPETANIIWGGVTLLISAWISGYIFALTYNYFVKNK